MKFGFAYYQGLDRVHIYIPGSVLECAACQQDSGALVPGAFSLIWFRLSAFKMILKVQF